VWQVSRFIFNTNDNKLPPHICYHIKFGQSKSNSIHINRRKPPKLGALGPRPLVMEVGLTPCKYTPPQVLSCQIWSFYVKRCKSRTEIPLKNFTRHVLLFRVTQGHYNRQIDWLPTTSYLCSIATSYCFRDKRRFPSKIANFSHPYVFNAPAEGVPLGIGYRCKK